MRAATQHVYYYDPASGEVVRASDGGKGMQIDGGAGEIARLARAATAKLPPGLIVGVALRESGFKWNEVDADLYDSGEEKPLRTYGLCMINVREAANAIVFFNPLNPAPALCDPARNVAAGCVTLRGHLEAIASAAGFDPDAPPRDAWPYVCWAHNGGLGAALGGISKYGFDWERMKARNIAEGNDYVINHLIPYAEKVLEYIDQYPSPTSGGGDNGNGGGEVTFDEPATVHTPIGDFDPYTIRKIIAASVLAGLVFFVAKERG